MDRRMQRAACRDLEKIVHESKNFFFPLVKCFPSEKSKSVKGSIEGSSPLRGGFVSPLIRDLESRRDVLTGQSTGYGPTQNTRIHTKEGDGDTVWRCSDSSFTSQAGDTILELFGVPCLHYVQGCCCPSLPPHTLQPR